MSALGTGCLAGPRSCALQFGRHVQSAVRVGGGFARLGRGGGATSAPSGSMQSTWPVTGFTSALRHFSPVAAASPGSPPMAADACKARHGAHDRIERPGTATPMSFILQGWCRVTCGLSKGRGERPQILSLSGPGGAPEGGSGGTPEPLAGGGHTQNEATDLPAPARIGHNQGRIGSGDPSGRFILRMFRAQ